MVDGRDDGRNRPSLFGGRIEGLGLWRLAQALRHRLAATGASTVIVSNPGDATCVVRAFGLRRRRIQIVPPGIDPNGFHFDRSGRKALRSAWPIDSEHTFVVGSAGRLVPGKGMGLLIEATARLAECGVPICTVIAGEGPYREALVHRAREFGVADRVRFLSFVENMSAFYSAVDAFALCSDTESFGLVLTEAMACGRPVVASRTAGATLQIEHEKSGLLLTHRGNGAIADALARLYACETTRRRLGRNARARAISRFTIDLTLERTLATLEARRRLSLEPRKCMIREISTRRVLSEQLA
jgi:glycosyltransferase involved in cell wall biosynthesis